MAKDKASSKAAAASAAADGGASKKRKRAESADGAKAAKAKSKFELVDGAPAVDASKLESDDVELVLIRVPAAVRGMAWVACARLLERRAAVRPRLT